MPSTAIKPSPEARQLFNVLVARSNDEKVLDLNTLLALSTERTKRGLREAPQMHELVEEGWIERSGHGFRIAI